MFEQGGKRRNLNRFGNGMPNSHHIVVWITGTDRNLSANLPKVAAEAKAGQRAPAGSRSVHSHRGEHGLDSRHVLRVVQLPELPAAGGDLDAENRAALFEEPELFEPLERLERPNVPTRIGGKRRRAVGVDPDMVEHGGVRVIGIAHTGVGDDLLGEVERVPAGTEDGGRAADTARSEERRGGKGGSRCW